MTCHELIDFLADYLAGALDARERTVLESHLVGCAACLEYVRAYRDTIRVAKDACADGDAATAMPTELVDAILATVASRRAR